MCMSFRWETLPVQPQTQTQTPPFSSNWEYRQHMQHANATQLMRTNALNAANSTGINPFYRMPAAHDPPSDLKQQYMAKNKWLKSLVSTYIDVAP